MRLAGWPCRAPFARTDSRTSFRAISKLGVPTRRALRHGRRRSGGRSRHRFAGAPPCRGGDSGHEDLGLAAQRPRGIGRRGAVIAARGRDDTGHWHRRGEQLVERAPPLNEPLTCRAPVSVPAARRCRRTGPQFRNGRAAGRQARGCGRCRRLQRAEGARAVGRATYSTLPAWPYCNSLFGRGAKAMYRAIDHLPSDWRWKKSMPSSVVVSLVPPASVVRVQVRRTMATSPDTMIS